MRVNGDVSLSFSCAHLPCCAVGQRAFRAQVAAEVVGLLSRRYHQQEIPSKDEFKHLCKKLTHAIIEKVGPVHPRVP